MGFFFESVDLYLVSTFALQVDSSHLFLGCTVLFYSVRYMQKV